MAPAGILGLPPTVFDTGVPVGFAGVGALLLACAAAGSDDDAPIAACGLGLMMVGGLVHLISVTLGS